MNDRPRLPLIIVSLLCLLPWDAKASDTAEATAKRPNILWIVGENFDLDFGCYGAKNVLTPNIDRQIGAT
jgi:hypothetical protein